MNEAALYGFNTVLVNLNRMKGELRTALSFLEEKYYDDACAAIEDVGGHITIAEKLLADFLEDIGLKEEIERKEKETGQVKE